MACSSNAVFAGSRDSCCSHKSRTCSYPGGVAGAVFDSVLGATAQARRWCEQCAAETERLTHDCGAPTRRARGVAWMDNDVVNFLSNTAGGLLAALLLR